MLNQSMLTVGRRHVINVGLDMVYLVAGPIVFLTPVNNWTYRLQKPRLHMPILIHLNRLATRAMFETLTSSTNLGVDFDKVKLL